MTAYFTKDDLGNYVIPIEKQWPAFQYVDELIEEKRFRNLKGLIYFTDGYGTFPEHKPPYTTAFLFVEEGYEIPEVPPWAIRLVLQHEDIIEVGVEI